MSNLFESSHFETIVGQSSKKNLGDKIAKLTPSVPGSNAPEDRGRYGNV